MIRNILSCPQKVFAGLAVSAACLAIPAWAESQPSHGDMNRHEQVLTQIQQGAVALNKESFVHLVLLRNPEVLVSAEQKKIAEAQLQHDRAAYEMEFFSILRADERKTENNPLAPNDTTIDRNGRFQFGVRTLVVSGAEVSVEYEGHKRYNNTSSVNDPTGINDNVGSLNFRIRQPILRGFGAAQIENRIAQSEKQIEIRKQETQQQILSKSYDALSLYWRLYRAEQMKALNADSLKNANNILTDIERRVQAGRLPQTAMTEARSTLLLRQAESFVVERGYEQVKSAIKGVLNLSANEYQHVVFQTTSEPDTTAWQQPESFQTYFEQVLSVWPNYGIAIERIALEEHSLAIARDELRPKLDFVAGYGQSSLRYDERYGRTFEEAFSERYPNWYAGVEFSIPLGGNQSARSKESIALSRITQNQYQAEAVKVDLSNQLQLRLAQVDQAYQELDRHRQNTTVLKELLEIERERFDRGVARYIDMIEREDNLNVGIIRMVDAEIQYELAKISLQLSDGSLLQELGIQFDVEAL
ncbi:TolC family protein [Chrysiogenes arsenatis]|uniref:TolC family protein n=1 Tax=Chrysiogenes arsenatis TaxID=309797 RepID=UPI000488B205|nr:TolC family protein [Chrysiogenes arsenatis]